jgi:hypothetical protein
MRELERIRSLGDLLVELASVALAPGDQGALREILRLYSGMGSFSDIGLYRDGKLLAAETDQLEELRTRLFDLARSLLR